jgi:hypothetical protein
MFVNHLAIVLIAFSLTSCASSKGFISQDINLKDYKNIYVDLGNTGGSQSIGGGALFGSNSIAGVAHNYDGDKQANLAKEKFVFLLREIGFNVVNNPGNSDAIAHLSIGQIRYDPLAGWIADQASLQVEDTKSRETIAQYIADGRLVTPTVNKIIKKLSKKVKKDFQAR